MLISLAPTSGTAMKIWECYSGLAAQTWYYTSDDRISLQNQGMLLFITGCRRLVLIVIPRFAGQCLDLTNGSLNDGTVMQIWECTDNDTNQVWTTTAA